MGTIEFTVGDGRYQVKLSATSTGRGINILLTGGESPHIGAVVMSIPRPSDQEKGLSADSWIIPVPGHKDMLVAQALGEQISRLTGQVTVVTAGIHIDQAEAWEIEQIRRNCTTAGEKLADFLTEHN